jgi:diketogulonate reductase-like aldo/keto reductase
MTAVPTVALPGGETIPVLGQGTWELAERQKHRAEEIVSLRTGIELGMTLIDTAEMYGSGAAEELVAEALGDQRAKVFLVSKVLPQHSSRRATIAACEASLRRLNTDRLDMYLLHWRGSVPLAETCEAFSALQREGKIRYWGVSNFDVSDMEEVARLPHRAGSRVATDQVLYNLTRRGIEHDLLPWCRARQIPVMAYSPLEQGRIANSKPLQKIAARLNASPAQVALAWILRQKGVVAIPKAGRVEHVRENRAALEITLSSGDVAELDKAFPPPKRKVALEMI